MFNRWGNAFNEKRGTDFLQVLKDFHCKRIKAIILSGIKGKLFLRRRFTGSSYILKRRLYVSHGEQSLREARKPKGFRAGRRACALLGLGDRLKACVPSGLVFSPGSELPLRFISSLAWETSAN